MDVSDNTLMKRSQSAPHLDEQTEKKWFRLEEYPEDIGKLIRELAMQESVVKAKEEAIKLWSETLADATKANEIEHEADTKKWQKALDDATKIKENKRQEEYKKWQKVKVDATTKRQSKHAKDLAAWQKVRDNALTLKHLAKAEKMMKELETSSKETSKEMKKAEKMLHQLAKEEESDTPTSEMKHAKKMLQRAMQGKEVPSNEMKRAEKQLRQLEGELSIIQAKVNETKKLIRQAAASADLNRILADEGETFDDDYETDDFLEESFSTVDYVDGSKSNCASNCTSFAGAWSHVKKNATACKACFE